MPAKPKEARIDLRMLRKNSGWTQKELAMKLDVERAHISSLENGHRRISLNMMQKLIAVFNLEYEDFFRHGS